MAPSGDMSLRGEMASVHPKVAATRHEAGPGAAVGLAARWGFAFVHRLRRGGCLRDARTGLRTAADFPESEIPENATHGDAVHYMPIPVTVFDGVMKDLGGISPADCTFIDLGCGKGAALVLALDRGFGSVIGVELNSRLVPLAEENLAAFTRRTADGSGSRTVIEGDVVSFRFPEAPLVVFLLVPFGAETLAVLTNLERALRDHPRDVFIAYASPVHGDRIDDSPLFRRLPTRSPRWSVWRAVAAAPDGRSTSSGGWCRGPRAEVVARRHERLHRGHRGQQDKGHPQRLWGQPHEAQDQVDDRRVDESHVAGADSALPPGQPKTPVVIPDQGRGQQVGSPGGPCKEPGKVVLLPPRARSRPSAARWPGSRQRTR